MRGMKTIITLGFLIALVPHLYFPGWLDAILHTVLGLAVAFLGILMVRGGKRRRRRQSDAEGDDAPRKKLTF